MNAFLHVVPDDVQMTREYFAELLQKFKHHRRVSYGFSKKHTEDIMKYRKSLGLSASTQLMPANLYSMPVEWNTEKTFVR